MSNAENVTDWNVTTCPGEVSEASFLWRGMWILSTVYNANDSVSNGGSSYICILPHTAAADNEPGEGVNWEIYWDVMALGGETINWKGTWNPAAAYELFDSVEHLGDSWVANTPTLVGEEPGVSAKWDLSAAGGQDGVSFIWQGLWVVQDYVVNDVVFFDQGGAIGASAYICILDTTAQQDPTNATYWDVMASGGADGAGSGDVTGPAGATTGNFATYLDTTGKAIADGGTPGTLAFLNEVSSSTIADGSVDTAELATDAVETVKILDANVTEAKLAASAVTNTKLATDAVSTVKILNDNVTNAKLVNVATATIKGRVSPATGDPEDLTANQASTVLDGATDPFLRTSAAGSGGGKVVNTWSTQFGAATSTSAVIPFDDTIPQITEGSSLLTLGGVTPSSASNVLEITWDVQAAGDAASIACTVALFDGSTDALAAAWDTSGGVNHATRPSGSTRVASHTDTKTYTVRFGPSSGTMRINGNNTGRLLGGVAVAKLTIMEIAPN